MVGGRLSYAHGLRYQGRDYLVLGEGVSASETIMQRQHEQITAACACLKPTASVLRNGISSHNVGSPISFTSLDTFTAQSLIVLGGGGGHDRIFVGSIDGELLVSARLRAGGTLSADTNSAVGAVDKASVGSKKRGRDDSAERAERAVADILKRCVGDAPVHAAICLARQSIESLLRDFKGAGGEEVVESCGLSMSPKGEDAPAGDSSRSRPRLIIACRLSAGVPLPLTVLRRSLGKCFGDGMITTHPEALGEAYRLPLSATGQVVENEGQRSILLFAAVPVAAVEVAVAQGSTNSASLKQAAPDRE